VELTLHNLGDDPRIIAACIYVDGKVGRMYPNALEINSQASLLPRAIGSDQLLKCFARFSINRAKRKSARCFYHRSRVDQINSRLRKYVGIVAVVLVPPCGCVDPVRWTSAGDLQTISGSVARPPETISGKKDYSLRARKDANDEVGALIDSFNRYARANPEARR
jgi:hypothetical protein